MVHSILPFAAVAHAAFAIWAFSLFGSEGSEAAGYAARTFIRGLIEVRSPACLAAWLLQVANLDTPLRR